MNVKPAYARKGWEYYTENRIWHPDGDVTLAGLKYNIQIYSEQTQSKAPPLTSAKYVDQSYLNEVLKQLAAK
jgi:hypothetical protein